jgi:hypothetical protein
VEEKYQCVASCLSFCGAVTFSSKNFIGPKLGFKPNKKSRSEFSDLVQRAFVLARGWPQNQPFLTKKKIRQKP